VFRNVDDADLGRIARAALKLEAVSDIERLPAALLETSMDIVACEHASYNEIDPIYGRTRASGSDSHFNDVLARGIDRWSELLPTHPLVPYFRARRHAAPRRLSDEIARDAFRETDLYNELFRQADTTEQLVLNLGCAPGDDSGAPDPLTIGVALCRKDTDFSDRDVAILTLFQRLAEPIVRRKRAEHYFALIASGRPSEDLLRFLMGYRLTPRLAEVCFWVLQGKSNAEVATILDVGEQTVRQHTIRIFRLLGVDGRMHLQQKLLMAMLDPTI
jgi:DNA-binding CsgD family transcriptional regulator